MMIIKKMNKIHQNINLEIPVNYISQQLNLDKQDNQVN